MYAYIILYIYYAFFSVLKFIYQEKTHKKCGKIDRNKKKIILICFVILHCKFSFFPLRFITGLVYCNGLSLASIRQLRIHEAAIDCT